VIAFISYDPLVHVKLGPLSISPHGVGIAVGFLLGARLMVPAAEKRGISADEVYALLTRAAIGAIIGARLAYVINHAGDYDNVLDVFRVWQGGISLIGGFFGAIVAAVPEMRRRHLSFWKVMDAAAPGMALGVTLGRIGDLIVGDHLGKSTSFFLGYKCPPSDVQTASPCLGRVVHQTALYDFFLTIILLALLLWLRRKARWDGFLILVFATYYGVGRLIEDFLREDVRHFGLTGSQWSSLLVVLVSVVWLAFRRRTPGWGRWDGAPTMAAPPVGEDESGEDGGGSRPG
jgi:phosphatidylglycerol:prolipoprotein diacylglycerol transferase